MKLTVKKVEDGLSWLGAYKPGEPRPDDRGLTAAELVWIGVAEAAAVRAATFQRLAPDTWQRHAVRTAEHAGRAGATTALLGGRILVNAVGTDGRRHALLRVARAAPGWRAAEQLQASLGASLTDRLTGGSGHPADVRAKLDQVVQTPGSAGLLVHLVATERRSLQRVSVRHFSSPEELATAAWPLLLAALDIEGPADR